MGLFKKRLASPLPKKLEGENETVHVLHHLNRRVGQSLSPHLQSLRYAVTGRNCIAHSAGLVKGYKYEPAVRDALSSLVGFGTSRAGFLGETVHISAGAVDSLARKALEWIPELDEQCSTNGTFHRHA